MVKSTQSVSWPKRDSICSFLRHLGPFGCITTALFSENANLWIPAISWHFTLLVSTDQTIEFLDGFLIFLSLPYVGKLRKIKKTSRNCIVWSVETSKVGGIFFRIFGWKIQKILKNSKKFYWPHKGWNDQQTTYSLTYNFCRNLKLIFLPQNGPYPKKLRNQKSEWHSGAGHVDGCCDRLGEFWTPPIKWGTLYIYRKYQEKQQRKTQCKIFHGGPVIGGYL